uniref:tRNA (guanine-N(7)-)-methyltransferase non-catalytic subunit n=1 Tax=Arcella intermedia TaxID=1963864 RepID=A0A6B2LAB1_9EUKA
MTADEKNLKLWDTKTWNLIIERTVQKKITSLTFSPTNDILWANKFGSVFAIQHSDFIDPSLQFANEEDTDHPKVKFLLGHCSLITHLKFCRFGEGFVLISTDRDEKIRTSLYPESYCILSYCLGHKGFISSIATIEYDPFHGKLYAITGSGDGTARLWSIPDGKPLDQHAPHPAPSSPTPPPTVKDLAIHSTPSETTLALIYEECAEVHLFNVELPSGRLSKVAREVLPSVPLCLGVVGGLFFVSTLKDGLLAFRPRGHALGQPEGLAQINPTLITQNEEKLEQLLEKLDWGNMRKLPDKVLKEQKKTKKIKTQQ